MKPNRYIIAAISILAGLAIGHSIIPPYHTQPAKPLDASKLVLSADAVEKAFDNIPDSMFKANTLIVMGAHLQGPEADAELNKILNEYALFKLDQIKNGIK